MRSKVFILIFLASLPLAVRGETTWRGFVAAEYRYFPREGLDPAQRNGYPSIVAQPELYVDWNEGRQSLTFTPFYRWDRFDENRSHGDIRELYWLYVGDGFELLAGINTVFWGVTESQHLVNIINQIDLVENPDGEDMLGQPMINAALFTSGGAWNIFLLPYFRERTFPGEAGRLRTQPRVDTDADALYEDSSEQSHTDYALRWTNTVGAWDFGVSGFYGTSRDPLLIPSVNSAGESVLLPYYEQILQTGLDLQATLTNWLLKLEAIHRSSDTEVYNASTSGFEYTFFGVRNTSLNVGFLAEYLYDSRGDDAPTPFQDDIFLGLRLVPNDLQGTLFLLSLIADRRSSTRIYSLEASRRLTDHIRVGIEARVFHNIDPADPLYSYRQDDYLQLELAYFF